MPDWDEEALKDLNSLDSARLAIRGALATIRDLQDQLSKQKAQIQDESARRKLVEARAGELNAQLERWQEQAKEWEAAERRRVEEEERYKASVRMQVRSEERAEIHESQRRLQEDLSRLQAELQRMAQGQREKETGWAEVKKRLEQREIELVQAEREKSELVLRYRQDMDTIAQLREARDREIAASIQSREGEISDRDREIMGLRRQNEEHKSALDALARELDLKLVDREEKLKREYLLREQSLQERYSQREMELQSAWSEVENGLWKRSKEAREKLDQTAAAQFEERARALADRSAELDALTNRRGQELDGAFKVRCIEAEKRYAELERDLQGRWVEKENRFLKKYGEEISAETERLQTIWQDKLKAADADRSKAVFEETKRREDLESEHRRLKENLLEDAARNEAERLRHHDDLIARKTAELERAHQERLSELSRKENETLSAEQARELSRREAFAEEKRQAEQELNRRRAELVDLNAKSLEAARAALDKQYEERARALDEAFAAKVAEVERSLKAAEEQFLDYKARLIADYGLKERGLDGRWSAREAELVRRQQTALEGQRADFDSKLAALEQDRRDERFRDESELLRRRKELDDHFDERRRALEAQSATREEELRRRAQMQFAKLREEHAQYISAREQNVAAEMARLKEDLTARLDEAARASSDAQARVRGAENDVREAGIRFQALWNELQTKERSWETERLALERQYREREQTLERKYQDMEQSLRAQWTKREAEAVETRLKALEAQHAHYAEQTAKTEENARCIVEEWRIHQTTELEKQKAAWLASREKDLDQRRKTLEFDHEQKLLIMEGEARKREKAYAARYAALERDLAKKWAAEHPVPPQDPPAASGT